MHPEDRDESSGLPTVTAVCTSLTWASLGPQPSREAALTGAEVRAAWLSGNVPGSAATSDGVPSFCPLQTVEPVDQLLRKVDPAKDRELWVREHKTGNIRPVDMEI